MSEFYIGMLCGAGIGALAMWLALAAFDVTKLEDE